MEGGKGEGREERGGRCAGVSRRGACAWVERGEAGWRVRPVAGARVEERDPCA